MFAHLGVHSRGAQFSCEKSHGEGSASPALLAVVSLRPPFHPNRLTPSCLNIGCSCTPVQHWHSDATQDLSLTRSTLPPPLRKKKVVDAYVHSDGRFGIVRFEQPDDARTAKQALNGLVHQGRVLAARYAQTNKWGVFVRRLPKNINNEQLAEAFRVFGDVSILLPHSRHTHGIWWGCEFAGICPTHSAFRNTLYHRIVCHRALITKPSTQQRLRTGRPGHRHGRRPGKLRRTWICRVHSEERCRQGHKGVRV